MCGWDRKIIDIGGEMKSGIKKQSFFKEVFTADDATAIYGSRLDGREEIEIPQERISKLKDSIKDSSTKTTVRIAGRLINVTVEVKPKVDVSVNKTVDDTLYYV